MKARLLLSLLVVATLAVSVGIGWRVRAASIGASTGTGGGNSSATGGAATDPATAPATASRDLVSARYAWPNESDWAKVPPLPEVRYAVVPLRALGWPIGNGAPIDATGGAAPAFELDDHNGVLGLRHWTSPYGVDWQAIYLRPGMGQAVDVPVMWKPFNFGDWGPAWTWPWQNFPGLWVVGNRVLNHHGLVAGWTLAMATDINGTSVIYGRTPSVWSLDLGPWNLAPPADGTYAIPGEDDGWRWSSLDTATAAGVNAYGQAIVWQTGLYDESYYSSENYPNGSSASDWSVSTDLSSSGWLIDVTSTVAPVSPLGGSLDFWYWEDGTSSTPADPVPPPEGWGPEGPPAPAPGTYSMISDGFGPDGDAFVPQFINDDGVVAGLHVTATGEWSDWDDDGLWEWEAWYTWTPVIHTADSLIELPVGQVDDVGLTGLTNGWYDSEGNQLAPPVAYGWSWWADGGDGDYESWWANEGPDGEWVLAPITAYPAVAGSPPAAGGQSVNPAILGSGLKRMNDRLELLVSWFAGADNYIVRNSRLYDLKNLITPGWKLWLAQDLNNSGVILAQATSPANLATDPDGWNPREPVLLVPAALRVDADRDGMIATNEPLPTVANPFRFWVNDDRDSGPMFTGHNDDVPLSGNDSDRNAADSHVNGVRDLVDFFAVQLDLWSLLEVLPPGNGFTYHLRQADGAVNVVFTDCTAEDASYHLRGDPNYLATGSGYGPALNQPAASATVAHVTAAGVELPPAFVAGLWEYGDGVILVEGRAATTAPLVLEVRKNGSVVASVDLPLRLGNVEDMFRHVNLTTVPKNYDGSALSPPEVAAPSRTDDPGEPWPDHLTNGKYFVFVHGFNVDATRARGWNVEVFKRLHARGSHARFVGVTWNGATGEKLFGSYTDYHQAVFNAFQTGNELAGALAFTNGADVTVAAHSLGNMVVSHAIQDGGFTPARYFLLNAATPIEAYTGGDAVDDMVEKEWKIYTDKRLHASHWHTLFPSSDHRSKLTWENRFLRVRTHTQIEAHNFYSPGDEVVANAPEMDEVSVLAMLLEWEFSYGAWKTQELVKGLAASDTLAALTQSRGQGGWGFNAGISGWHVVTGQNNGATLTRRLYPEEISEATVPSAALKTKPFFGLFLEAGLTSTNSVTASNLAGDPWVQYDVLARGIPAKSHAMATTSLSGLAQDRNFDMQADGRVQGQWPTEGHPVDDDIRRDQWLHSDFKDVALPYVRPMFEEMINRGALK